MGALKHFVSVESFDYIAEHTLATKRKSIRSMLGKIKLVNVSPKKLTCKCKPSWLLYSLPEFLKQVEEIKEHQHLLKDLKNSRTLPILSANVVSSFDLGDYCLCNLSAVTLQPPKIILPSPSPLLKECEMFAQPEKGSETTVESTLIEVVGFSPMSTGSYLSKNFAAACF